MHILIIDDEPAVRQILAAAVTRAGHSAAQAATAAAARSELARGDVDIALCDIQLPDGDGINIVRESGSTGIETAFIMVTAFASVETAVEALRAGAVDYVTKPVHSEELLHRIAQVETFWGLREENRLLRRVVSEGAPKLFRFTSPAMLEVERMVSKVAPTDSTALITGESGTGKGVVARMIHAQSARRDMQFLAVNCSAIPEQLLESEFFGHTKGAFTSAAAARKGLFLQAEKGTLFLDEIGELPLRMQSKLLNVIEDREVRALGSDHPRRVDTRIIAATNRNLQERIAEGAFREDLYFRLSMFQIRVPPLRERQGDVPGLLRFLLQGTRAKPGPGGGAEVEIDPLAEEILLSYGWPGNVRELENVVNRARILAEHDRIGVGDLPSDIIGAGSTAATGTESEIGGGLPLREQVRRFEVEVLTRAIESAGGDRRVAARRLGIGLSSLYRKLDELGR